MILTDYNRPFLWRRPTLGDMLKTTIFFLLAAGAAVEMSMIGARPVAAQTPSNDPWSWCNFHSYNQPINEEECEESQTTISLPTITPAPNAYPSPTAVPSSPIRTLLEQHALLSAYFLMAHYDARADAAYWQQTLDTNTQALGTAIGAAYGQSAQTSFDQMWQQHISLLGQYADSVKMGSQNSAGIAKAQLNDNIGYLAAFFQNQNHSAADLRALFTLLTNDETSIIDNYALGNQQAVTGLLSQAPAHADMIADAITGPSGELIPTVTPTP